MVNELFYVQWNLQIYNTFGIPYVISADLFVERFPLCKVKIY